MSKFFLVLNPGSNSFRCRYSWPKIFESLRARKIDFDFAITEREGHATKLAHDAAAAGFGVVVAVGGDGTINEVINGLFSPDSTKSAAILGVIYTGTSPDFCKYHKIPISTGPAIDLLLSEKTKRVDLCRISHQSNSNSEEVHRVFSCSANFGLGAAVARGSNSGLRKVWGDFFGTLFSVFRAIFYYQVPAFHVKIDGVESTFPRVFNIFIGKNPLIASSIKLKLDISPDDGNLYFLPMHSMSKTQLLAYLPRIYTGSIVERFPPRYVKRVEILDGQNSSEVEYDGDPRGLLPARIEVLRKALELIRPE